MASWTEGKGKASGNASIGPSGGSSSSSSSSSGSSSSSSSSSSGSSGGGGNSNRPGRPLAPGQTPIAPTRTTSGESVTVTSSGALMSGGGSLTPGGGVFQYRGTGGGGGGSSNPNANFSTVDGREVFVASSGREANFSRRDGQSVYVPPPIAPRSGRDYQGRSSADFSSDIRRALPVNQLSEESRRGAAENIISRAEGRIDYVNRGFSGASDVFGWVPGLGGDNKVGKFGRAALAAPFTFATAPAVVAYGGVVKLKTAEAVSSVYPEAIPSIKAESNRAFFRAPAEVGTMTKDLFTTPEGLGTVVGGGLLLGGLNGRSPSAPRVNPTGEIRATFKGTIKGTTEGNVVAPPVAPRGTLTMTYTGRPSGFVNRLLGREADVAVRVGPRGDVSQVVKIGAEEFRTTQRAGASYSRTRVFKDGRATGMFEGAPLSVGGSRATVLDVIARETRSSSKNVKPDVLVQGVKAGRLVDLEVPTGGGVLRGSFVQESRGGALSRVERGRGSVTGLNLETEQIVSKIRTVKNPKMMSDNILGDVVANKRPRYVKVPGTRTRIVGEPYFKETSLKETLRVGSPEEVARFERQASENRLSIGKNELILDEAGARRPSQLGIISKERGKVKTSFEYDVTTQGTFSFVKSPGVFSRARSNILGKIGRMEARAAERGAASRSAANRDWARVVRERPMPVSDQLKRIIREAREVKKLPGTAESRRDAALARRARDDARVDEIRSSRSSDIAGLSELRELEKLGAGNRARGGRSLNVDSETGLPEFSGRGRQVLEPPRTRSRSTPGELDFASLKQNARPVGRSQPVFAQEMFREVRVSASRSRALYGFPVVSQRSLLGSSVVAGPVSGLVQEPRVVPDQIITPGIVEVPKERYWPVQSQSFRPFEPFVPGSEPFVPIEGPPSGFVPPVFALPFGGGGSFGFPSASRGNQRFKNAYSPSITGGLFNVKGSRRQANIATITGLGVRPMQLT